MQKINLTDLQKRKLNNFYVVVFVVVKNIKIKTETCIASKQLYILFGLNILGNREVLGMFFENESDNRFWLEKFEDFQSRNLNDILFFVTPPNKNIERCVKIVYNNVQVIHSPEDIFQKINKFFADHPARKMRVALKDLFFAKDIEEYKVKLDFFKEIYVDNNIILIMLDTYQREIEKYYEYPQYLRLLFYPYYLIYEMKKYLNKLITLDSLCCSINEVIEFCLPYINSFEIGRTHNRKEWLDLISLLYSEYGDKLEVYING